MIVAKKQHLLRCLVYLALVLHLYQDCPLVDADRAPVTDCRVYFDGGKSAAKLTCSYPWDLNQTQISFTVYRFNETAAGYPETILRCNWRDGEPVCLTLPGSDPPKMVSNVFSIMVFQNGRRDYCCDIFPAEKTNIVKRCHTPPEDQPKDRAKQENSDQPDHRNSTIKPEVEADRSSPGLLFYVSIGFNIFAVIASLFCSYSYCKRKGAFRKNRRKRQQGENEMAVPMRDSCSKNIEVPSTTDDKDQMAYVSPQQKFLYNYHNGNPPGMI